MNEFVSSEEKEGKQICVVNMLDSILAKERVLLK
jgi:hypothetical protein